MRANELMKGDWISYTEDGKPYFARVSEVYQSSVFTEDGYFEGREVEEDEIMPIPLTPEILEKNGFKKSDYGWYNRKIDEWEIEIYIGRIETFVKINKGVYPHINNTDCRFLHKLQHALNLCGIEKEITL